MLRTQEHIPEVEAWVGLLRAHASTTRALSFQLQNEHGLSINDYEALLLLCGASEGRMRRVDLAERLQLTASGVTRLLEGLERAGLVERHLCRSDLRVAWAVVTPAGRDRLEQASCSHVRGLREVFAERFDEEELTSLGELLSRLSR